MRPSEFGWTNPNDPLTNPPVRKMNTLLIIPALANKTTNIKKIKNTDQ